MGDLLLSHPARQVSFGHLYSYRQTKEESGSINQQGVTFSYKVK